MVVPNVGKSHSKWMCSNVVGRHDRAQPDLIMPAISNKPIAYKSENQNTCILPDISTQWPGMPSGSWSTSIISLRNVVLNVLDNWNVFIKRIQTDFAVMPWFQVELTASHSTWWAELRAPPTWPIATDSHHSWGDSFPALANGISNWIFYIHRTYIYAWYTTHHIWVIPTARSGMFGQIILPLEVVQYDFSNGFGGVSNIISEAPQVTMFFYQFKVGLQI